MLKKGLQFILVWNNSSKLKRFNFSFSQLLIISILIFIILSGIFVYSVRVFSDVLYYHRLANIRKNNQELLVTISQLRSKLVEMEDQLARIEEKDKAIRLYANFPDVDQDIRKLGIGGNRYEKAENLNRLLPGNSEKISDLLADLENLQREIKLEKLSFESIYQKVNERENLLSSTPSIRPIADGYLTDGFGYRRDPFTGEARFHYGIDISARMGTKVYATADGIVRYAKWKGGFGKCIKIDHGYGYVTLYAHLSKFHVTQGDFVKRGQIIAEVGSTGRSTAPHLHYEVHYNNTPKNPIDFFFTPPADLAIIK